eukprot:TRINITY_DN3544_c0_g1_i4.p1 TRINITY_DN3544_c0_g1~~TRINITY_DN3544_c0_g1_i4.p1  ORF type:complete len:625 (+),score=102.59 TRINITY_DN3544_c0_g1_i4:20-1894(+)
MADLRGGLDIWPFKLSETEEPALFSISESQQQNLSHWQALAHLVDSAAQKWNLGGQLPCCRSEERPQRIVGFTAAVDTHSLSLAVRRKHKKSSCCGSLSNLSEAAELQTFSVPLLGTDVLVAKVEASHEGDSSDVPQCILGLAPRHSVSSLGEGGAWERLDESLDDSDGVWLFCVGCQVDLPCLLDTLGRCGAIRSDFEEAWQLGKKLPRKLWVGGMYHRLARASAESRKPRRVAVKTAEDEWRSLAWEIALLVRFQSHPNIVRFHGAFVGQAEQEAKLTFDLHAATVHSAIEAAGLFSQERGCEIMIGLTRALACLHRQRLVHRNVQNSTVLLDKQGEAVLSGLNSVACVDDIGEMNNYLGVPGFVAPEVLGLQAYGVRADVFSAGVVFYCMVSGRYPFGSFTGGNLKQVKMCTLQCQPNFGWEGHASLPASLLFLLRSMLSKSPRARPPLADANERCRRWLSDKMKEEHGADVDSEPGTNFSLESALEARAKLPKLPQLGEEPFVMEQPAPICTEWASSRAKDREVFPMEKSVSDCAWSEQKGRCSAKEAASKKPAGRSILRCIGSAIRGAKVSLPVAWRMTSRRSVQVAPEEDGFIPLVPAENKMLSPQGQAKLDVREGLS